MSGLRPPVVAGVGGGVATTTLAVALRGHDAGRAQGDGADILACRGRLDSLRRAAAVLEHASAGPRPVLAVTLDGWRPLRGPVRVRLEQLRGRVSAVVLLPDVGRWRSVADPLPEVAGLLVDPGARLPRPLRAYAAALRDLAAAVAASGRLRTAAPRSAPPPAPPPPPAPRPVVPPPPPRVAALRPVVGPVTATGPAGPPRGLRIVAAARPPAGTEQVG